MATTYTIVAPNIDAVLYALIAETDATLPELQISAAMASQGMTVGTLPDLQLDISLDDKIWSGEILPGEERLPLPVLALEARFGERAETGDGSGWGLQDLPHLQATGHFAPRMDTEEDHFLPLLECSAAATGEELLSLVRTTLPSLSLSARSGIRGNDDLKLPSLSLTIGIEGDSFGTLDKRLTFPAIDIEISADNWGGSLSRDLTFPSISATGFETPLMSMSGTLPGMRITASALSGAYGTLDETLPDLRISATAWAEEFGTLDADLPTLTNQDWGGGSEGSAGSGTLTNRARFNDYILRHSRW
jgi:hypothetical protein